MRAARYYGKEDLRIDEIQEPQCGPGEVKIRPAFTGLCGTDLHEYLGGPNFAPVSPHPITKATLPITFGHEFSGTVAAIGPGVTSFTPGQHVSIQPTISDGTCSACISHLPNVCHSGGFVGLSGLGGGLADFIVLPESYILPLPSNIPLDVAALIEPLAVGWHAVSLSPLSQNGQDNILILGGGPIGISVIQALRARGCGTIIVSEISTSRQKYAAHFGADIVLDPLKEDVLQRVQEITDGKGVDIVFDCAGVASGLETACKAIRARGTVVNVAIWEGKVLFQPNDLVFKEGRYIACLGYVRGDFEDVIEAIATGKITPADMITTKIPLERVVEDGFLELIRNKEQHVKVLVQI